jgi:hypothetical protein
MLAAMWCSTIMDVMVARQARSGLGVLLDEGQGDVGDFAPAVVVGVVLSPAPASTRPPSRCCPACSAWSTVSPQAVMGVQLR